VNSGTPDLVVLVSSDSAGNTRDDQNFSNQEQSFGGDFDALVACSKFLGFLNPQISSTLTGEDSCRSQNLNEGLAGYLATALPGAVSAVDPPYNPGAMTVINSEEGYLFALTFFNLDDLAARCFSLASIEVRRQGFYDFEAEATTQTFEYSASDTAYPEGGDPDLHRDKCFRF
jgi:hypothetical protein